MFIQLEALLGGGIESLPLDYEFDFSKEELGGVFPFTTPVTLKGEIRNTAGIVTIEAKADFSMEVTCDRCAEDIKPQFTVNVEHGLVASLNHEDNDDYILVEDMKLDATVTVRDGDNDNTIISIDGESAGVLIGHHGDTLDSLQYLANLAANKRIDGTKPEYCKITIDIENYRAKREETLRTLARHMASKVVRYKKSVMLEPMNPYERRIIHSEIQGIKGVSTNSIGSENNRKIVIYLDDKKSDDAE